MRSETERDLAEGWRKNLDPGLGPILMGPKIMAKANLHALKNPRTPAPTNRNTRSGFAA
jgi:hypothetical protein